MAVITVYGRDAKKPLQSLPHLPRNCGISEIYHLYVAGRISKDVHFLIKRCEWELGAENRAFCQNMLILCWCSNDPRLRVFSPLRWCLMHFHTKMFCSQYPSVVESPYLSTNWPTFCLLLRHRLLSGKSDYRDPHRGLPDLPGLSQRLPALPAVRVGDNSPWTRAEDSHQLQSAFRSGGQRLQVRVHPSLSLSLSPPTPRLLSPRSCPDTVWNSATYWSKSSASARSEPEVEGRGSCQLLQMKWGLTIHTR